MSKLKTMLHGFFKYRFLLRELVSRDIKIRYRRSVLGLLWTVLNPILMMGVMTIVFSNIFRFDIENFPIYFFAGNILFSFMTESTTNALYSIVSSGSLIKKVYIPKYLFPISKILSSTVNLVFSFLSMLLVMVVTRAPFHPTLLLSPIAAIYVIIFSAGVGLLLSTAMTFFRDVAHLYSVLTLAWMYLTPIFYPPSLLQEKLPLVLTLNPMYHYISMMRDLVLYGKLPSLSAHLVCLSISFGTLLVGLLVFYKKQERFILFV